MATCVHRSRGMWLGICMGTHADRYIGKQVHTGVGAQKSESGHILSVLVFWAALGSFWGACPHGLTQA